MLRIVVLALVILVGGACAKPPRERRVTADQYVLEACFGRAGKRIEPGRPGACDDKAAKAYSDAFERDEPVIELVTMGIGELIWERHGHIALCVRRDPKKLAELIRSMRDPMLTPQQRDELVAKIEAAKDICYNYGIADFQAPLGMAAGFFRGTKSFWAGEQEVPHMMGIYINADRTMWVQPLPLDAKQKQQVIKKLESDILEQNKYYAYDHFWDNCTTRVRDIIDDAADHALLKMKDEPTDGRTYRELAREGFFGMRVPLIITDIAMGRVTDRTPDYWERMFLPQYLREAVHQKWKIDPIVFYVRRAGVDDRTDANANKIPDVLEDADGDGIPDFEEQPESTGRFGLALIILLLAAPAVAARRFGRFQRSTLALAVIPYVLLGSILWFLAIISPLEYVMWNESLLLFLPLDVMLLGFLGPDRRQKYARGRVVMLGLFAVLSIVGVFHQPLLSPLLAPLIPAALVGFWRPEWTLKKPEPAKQADAKTKSAKPAKA